MASLAGILILATRSHLLVMVCLRVRYDKRAVLGTTHDLNAGGSFRIAVKTSTEQQSLLRCIACLHNRRNLYTLMRVEHEATRMGSVAIKLGRYTIGQLSRDDARLFRRAQLGNGWPRPGVLCPAQIVRNYSWSDDMPAYSVYLDLPCIDTHDLPAMAVPVSDGAVRLQA